MSGTDADDDSDDSAEMRELLRKVAAAPSIDPAHFSNGRLPSFGGLQPGTKLGHFKILERIGAGGMGIVYRAEDERLRRQVALKVLPPHQVFDRERRRRMWREAQSAAAVNHPNIAAIYELGEDEAGTVYIAMEYLGGQPLRRYLHDGPLPPREALRFALQIADALARAHQAGIVHRDLKPDNVMVLPDRTVKILDFGLAKLLAAPEERLPATSGDESGSASTKDGQIVGTPRYMSPEQKSGALVDARADLYAFGVVLAELLTGKWPDADRRDAASLRRDADLRGPDGWLVEALLAISARCLQTPPSGRYADGAELLGALREVLARAEPSTSGVHPLVRRPLPLARFALAALVLIAVAGAATWFGLRRGRPATNALAPASERMLERRLTANPPDNPVLDAALSTDGRQLAYVDRSGLFIRAIDPPSTEQVPLKEKLALRSVAWLAGEDALLVSSRLSGESGSELWRVRRDGSAQRLETGLFERPRPSPDGKLLAWIEPKGIAVGPLSAPLQKGRIVVQAREDDLDQLSWSPDGRHLAYVRLTETPAGTEARLESVAVAGGAPTVLLQNARLIQENGGAAMTWTPDARVVFALAERPPREMGFTLWAMPVALSSGAGTEEPRLLHSWSGSTPGLLTASGDGALAYARTETQSDVYLAELGDGGRRLLHPRRLTLSDRNERPSGWTADSRAVLLTSDQDGSNDIFAQDVSSGAAPRRLIATRAAETWPAYSSNGALLFWEHPYSAEDVTPHRAQLRALQQGAFTDVLQTQQPCDHAGGELPPRHAQFRCPARGDCVLGEQSGTQLVFTPFTVEGGRGKELFRVENPGKAGVGWDVSRDGARLAIPGASGQVRLVDRATGKSVDRYLQHGCEVQHVAFAPEGAALYATAICAGDRPYKLFYAEPNRAAQVLWDSSSTWFGYPVVSPDGKYLAFAVRPYDNDVWLASGF